MIIKAACLILASHPLDAVAFTARPTAIDRHPSSRSSSSYYHSDDELGLPPSFPPSPTTTTTPTNTPPLPPPPTNTRMTTTATTTTDPHTILGLSRLSPPRDFSTVQRAYRDLARRYHPDAIVGPDASSEERERANVIFARINGAYEELKASMRGGNDDDAENGIFEVVIMGGNFETGKRDRRVKYRSTSTSDVGGGGTGGSNTNARRRHFDDPDGVNYDRILELRKRTNLKGKNWSDPGEFEYPSGGRHNGDFGPPRRW